MNSYHTNNSNFKGVNSVFESNTKVEALQYCNDRYEDWYYYYPHLVDMEKKIKINFK